MQSAGVSDGLLDTLILFGFKLFIWTSYLLTPLLTVILMVRGVDPQFYIVKYMRTAYLSIRILARAVTLNNNIFLRFVFEIGLVIGRFFAMIVALYEVLRVMGAVFGSVYIIVNIATKIAELIPKIVMANRRRIQAGLFHRHILYYVMIQMAVQTWRISLRLLR